MVVVFADVPQNQGRNRSVKVARNEVRGYLVRQMPASAHHALLHRPGIRSNTQHFDVMVRFENHDIRPAQVDAKRIRYIAEIGRNGDFDPATAESVADGIDCIMRNRETRNVEIPDGKRAPGPKDLNRRLLLSVPLHRTSGSFRHVNGKWPGSLSR